MDTSAGTVERKRECVREGERESEWGCSETVFSGLVVFPHQVDLHKLECIHKAENHSGL